MERHRWTNCNHFSNIPRFGAHIAVARIRVRWGTGGWRFSCCCRHHNTRPFHGYTNAKSAPGHVPIQRKAIQRGAIQLIFSFHCAQLHCAQLPRAESVPNLAPQLTSRIMKLYDFSFLHSNEKIFFTISVI
jgi:hypothetical protein